MNMKNLRIRSAFMAGILASLASASGAWAQSSLTIYGIMDAGVDISNHGKGSLTRAISGGQFGSRLGFRGTEDLGGGLSANFRLEMGINLDDGTFGQGGRVFGREATVGLGSKQWGDVSLGRGQMPYYLVQFATDAFVWGGNGGLLSITRNSGPVQQLLPLAVSARFDNSVSYASPVFGGLQLRAQVAAGEGSTTIGRGYSASARYNAGPIDAVVGMARQQGAGNSNGDVQAVTVGGSYAFGFGKTFVGYTREQNSCTTCTGALARGPGISSGGASDFGLINVGMRIPIDQFVAIWQVTRVQDRSDYLVSPGGRDATWLAIGGEYYISKRTNAYVSVGTVNNRNGSAYALGTGAAQQPAGVVALGDPRAKAMGVGIRHTF
jgi:predicted porin